MRDAVPLVEAPLQIGSLAVGSIARRASGWWGMVTLVATEAVLFSYLLFSYFYLATQSGPNWYPAELPSFTLSAPSTAILIASSIAVWFAEKGAETGSRGRLVAGLLVGLALGTIFVGLQVKEWLDKPFTLSAHPYGSMYFTVTGFHLAHVVVGLVILAVLTVWSALGYFDRQRMAPVAIGALYWHFVDAVWLAVFFSLYITPHLR